MSPTDEEIFVAQKIREDFKFFCSHLILIKSKDGSIIPFKFNKAQDRLWLEIKEMSERKVPIRIVILKARQMGMSTFVQAYLFWKALTQPGHGGLVVAHQEDPASELFGKIEMMYRNLPEDYYNALESIKDTKKKGKKLDFAGDLNTSLYVDTANNKSLGRSQTFQHAHLSELAFYDKPNEILYGLGQSIPRKAGTTIFVESTANGMGNYFHNMWLRAVDGESSYKPVFFPWFDEPEYRLAVPDGFKLTGEERKIKSRYKLSDEQLAWRRQVISDECEGDVDLFRQEYPAEPQEAFLVSGNPYFNRSSLEWYLKNVELPIRSGDIALVDGTAQFVDGDNGTWRIYKKPNRSSSYVIGADVAGGSAKDFSAAIVLDANSLEVVATYRHKLDPDEFARQLKWMGITYNKALLAVEKVGEGRATLLKLMKELQYPRIFYHTTEENWSGGVVSQYGWNTSSRTRPTMIAQASEFIRTKALKCKDDRVVDELMSFIRVDSSKLAEAATGANDDMVMALCIALSSEVRAQAYNMSDFEGDYQSYPMISDITGY